MSHLSAYYQPILVSLIAFPFLAALLTLPYGIINYHRYGGISFWKALLFYSFVLYMLCAFLLTVLPLPTRSAVAAQSAVQPCLVPFQSLIKGLAKLGFDPDHPKTLLNLHMWKSYLHTNSFFQIFANILLLIPEGIFLRYYFGCGFRKTFLLVFLTSLFYELTQLSGLYGIYVHAYRCADVNDLITNTFGGIIGYLLAPIPAHFLPSRESMEARSREKGSYVSVIQEFFAELLDWIIVAAALGGIFLLWRRLAGHSIGLRWVLCVSLAVIFLYFVVLQTLLRGSTPGKELVRVRLVERDSGEAGRYFFRFLLRAVFLYVVYPLVAAMNLFMISAAAMTFVSDCEAAVRVLAAFGAALTFGVTLSAILHAWHRIRQLPHNYFSHLKSISTIRES